MKKALLFVLAVLLLLGAVPFSASAAEGNVVYVADGENGAGTSPDAPCNNLETALGKLDLTVDGTVVFVGAFTQSDNFDYGFAWKKLTFTSSYGGVDYAATKGAKYSAGGFRITMKGELVFDNLHFVMTAKNYLVVCQNHSFVTTETFTMDCTNTGTIGLLFGSSFGIVMGYQNGTGRKPAAEYSENNKIEICGGKNILIACGNRQVASGNNSGCEEVVIGGNAEIGNLYLSSVNAANIENGDIVVTVKDNANVKMINGPVDTGTKINSVTLNWLGGSIGGVAILNAELSDPPEKGRVNATVAAGTYLNYAEAVQNSDSFASVAQVFDSSAIILIRETPTQTEPPQTTAEETPVASYAGLPTFGSATVPFVCVSVLMMTAVAVVVILFGTGKKKN